MNSPIALRPFNEDEYRDRVRLLSDEDLVNPVEFLKVMMSERRKMSREQVIGWLELVREDATKLGDVWAEAAATLGDGPVEESAGAIRILRRANQEGISYRLREFYKVATLAIDGRVKTNVWAEFMQRLASVVLARSVARAEAEELREDSRVLILGMEGVGTDGLRDAINLLQKEVASLDVFIKTMKASPGAIRG